MQPFRILIADDHEVVRHHLRGLLKAAGFEVCGEAVDGLDAIEKAQALHPEIILLDITMPRMNGLEAARRLRAIVPGSKILIVSQHNSPEMAQVAMEAGADGYLVKTDIPTELVTALKAVREGRQFMSRALSPHAAAHAQRPAAPSDLECLAGGGEMGELMRRHDWSKTGVGPISAWPQALRIALRILLGSGYPMYIAWGPSFTQFYNDAYRPILGKTKHPSALGAGTPQTFSEIWDFIGPMFRRVLSDGQATTLVDQSLFLDRNGYLEECYYTFSYSPIPDDQHGKIGGVFVTVIEVTERLIEERRLRTLSELATGGHGTESEAEVCSRLAEILHRNRRDMPFALIYRYDDEGNAILAGASGIAAGHRAAPERISLSDAQGSKLHPWLAARMKKKPQTRIVSGLARKFGEVPRGDWEIAPESAAVVPIAMAKGEAMGFLVAALNPYKEFDEHYRGFLERAAGYVAAGMMDARAYAEERQRAESLAELDRAKTRFFSNVSHEFRTPLTLMLGPLEDLLAQEGPETSSPMQAELALIHRNGLRLLKLVNTLLDFSRIESGRAKAVFEEVDLAEYTSDVASVFRSAMERAGLRFTIECDRLARPVSVDRDMWEKIVLNLLSNAFKFTFQGEVKLTLKAQGDAVELAVSDTGTGIPPADLPLVFERFHRVTSSPGRSHEGTGIGLALVRELAKLHGGTVRVESELGRGSRFVVTIPQTQAGEEARAVTPAKAQVSTAVKAESYVDEALRWLPAESGAEPAATAVRPSPAATSAATPAWSAASAVNPGRAGSSGLGRELVLLADDNSDMRAHVGRLLGERYRVCSVTNGEEALRAVAELKPDLVLADVMMPVMDGFELLEAMRNEASYAAIPVILLSARAGEESRLEGLRAGADDYLVKPFTSRELMARVAAHLAMARLRRQAGERVAGEYSRLRELFLQTPVAIAMTSGPDHRFVFVNQSYVTLTCRERVEDFIGKTMREALPEGEGQGFFELLDEAYASGKPFSGRQAATQIGPQRRNAFVDFAYQPVRGVAGEVDGMLVTVVDVTEQVVARQRLQEAHDDLEERVSERTAELQRAEQGLRALSNRLLHTQDEERRRLARELHDSAGQMLAALNMNLSAMAQRGNGASGETARAIQESMQIVEELSRELRTMSHLLHPPLLDEAGLPSAVRWFAQGFSDRSKIATQVEIAPELGRLPRDLETTIFRLVQECLTNIHRHSGSSTAEIVIGVEGDEIRVQVRDQGKGLPADMLQPHPGQMRGGVGIQGMRERVRELGGRLSLDSTANGTTVLAVLPRTTEAGQEQSASVAS